jgi:predicted nucleic acid-binding protein
MATIDRRATSRISRILGRREGYPTRPGRVARPGRCTARVIPAIVPDVVGSAPFWLHEACNVLWLQVRRKLFTPKEAREALALLRAQVEPTPTAELSLHDVALEIGLTVNHSTYDTLYVAFALAMGAERVVVADGAFVTAMQTHPDPTLAGILLPLAAWASGQRA